MSILNTIMGGGDIKLNDQIIANDMIFGAKSGATAYLTAALESATPEVKALFSNNLTQMIQGHQTMTELAVKKGWYKPYLAPTEQLADMFSYSETVTGNDA